MNTKYQVVIYWNQDTDSFVAEAPELPGCRAEGASHLEALTNVQVAVQEWVETASELGRPLPQPAAHPSGIPQMAGDLPDNGQPAHTIKLTRREMDVLYLLIMEAKSADEVADTLACSKRTVDFHLANIYRKLQVSNRAQAICRAQQLGLLRDYGLV